MPLARHLRALALLPVLMCWTSIQDSALAQGHLYWTSVTDGVHRANLDGTGSQTLVGGLGASFGLALHPVAGRLFFSEHTGLQLGRIQSSDLDGSNVQVVTTNGYIFGVAVDRTRDSLWWASNISNSVRRSSLDGSGVVEIAPGIDPVGLALDEVNGKVYWSDAGDSRIRRANLDGSVVEVIVPSILVGFGGGLVADAQDGYLFWAENSHTGRIWRGGLNGSNPTVIVSGIDTSTGIGLALDLPCSQLYWSERATGRIVRANLDGSGAVVVMSGLAQPTAIVVVEGGDCATPTIRSTWGSLKAIYRN